MDAVTALHECVIPVEPAATYEQPFDVVRDMTLTRCEKIEVLHRWLASLVHAGKSLGEDRADHVCALTKALQFLDAPTGLA